MKFRFLSLFTFVLLCLTIFSSLGMHLSYAMTNNTFGSTEENYSVQNTSHTIINQDVHTSQSNLTRSRSPYQTNYINVTDIKQENKKYSDHEINVKSSERLLQNLNDSQNLHASIKLSENQKLQSCTANYKILSEKRDLFRQVADSMLILNKNITSTFYNNSVYNRLVINVGEMNSMLSNTSFNETWKSCNITEPIIFELSKIHMYALKEIPNELDLFTSRIHIAYGDYLQKIADKVRDSLLQIFNHPSMEDYTKETSKHKNSYKCDANTNPIYNKNTKTHDNERNAQFKSTCTIVNHINEQIRTFELLAKNGNIKQDEYQRNVEITNAFSKLLATNIDKLKDHTASTRCWHHMNECSGIEFLVTDIMRMYLSHIKLKLIRDSVFRKNEKHQIEDIYKKLKTSALDVLSQIFFEPENSIEEAKNNIRSIYDNTSYHDDFSDELSLEKELKTESSISAVITFFVICFFILCACITIIYK